MWSDGAEGGKDLRDELGQSKLGEEQRGDKDKIAWERESIKLVKISGVRVVSEIKR